MKNLINTIVPKVYGFYFNAIALFSKKVAAKKAFDAFCAVRKRKLFPNQKEYLDRVKNEVHTIGTHRIQSYHWQGIKETVLLVHGWESNTFRWRNLIKKLTKADFNIIAFDAPGHGHSSGSYLNVPLYAESLQYMIESYKPKLLVGHSVGGMTILYHQHAYAKSGIEKIVTIGAPSEFYEIMDHYQHLLQLSTRVMKALDTYIKGRFGFHIHDFSTSEFARSNASLGLLFHDRLDTIAPYHASEKVHTNWKNSILVSTEGLGHSMHQDDINEQIKDFLDRGRLFMK